MSYLLCVDLHKVDSCVLDVVSSHLYFSKSNSILNSGRLSSSESTFSTYVLHFKIGLEVL